MKMSERQLQDAVLELAGVLGWLSYHTFDARRSAAGFPDLVLVRAPRLLFVELKAASGRVSPAQQAWALEVSLVHERVGALVDYHRWTPAEWQTGEVERELRWRPS